MRPHLRSAAFRADLVFVASVHHTAAARTRKFAGESHGRNSFAHRRRSRSPADIDQVRHSATSGTIVHE
jgi:hypothetical protein